MEFQENSLLVSVPDNRHFRLENCQAYVQVKGKSMKEMDVGWIEGDDVWLLELKDYGQYIPANVKKQIPKLEENLPHKVRDTLTMIGAAWASTSWGAGLMNDIQATCPEFPTEACTIRVGAVINIDDPSDVALLSQIKDRIAADLDGELDVMGVQSVVVLPADQPWLQETLGITITEVPL